MLVMILLANNTKTFLKVLFEELIHVLELRVNYNFIRIGNYALGISEIDYCG